MNIERESVQPPVLDTLQRRPLISKNIIDHILVNIKKERDNDLRFEELIKKSDKYLNHPKKNKIVFNDEEVSFLINRDFDFTSHLLIDSLTPNQVSKVLDETIKEDSDPDEIYSLCEIIGKGKYGERLSPSLVDYVSQSKDLISDEVLNDPSSTVGLSYIFGDRSAVIFKNLPTVPNWALSRFWNNLADKDSSLFSNFLIRHIQKNTLNKDFEEKGLGYVLNHLTLESTEVLLKKIYSDKNTLINHIVDIIIPKITHLDPRTITKFTSEFLSKTDSVYYQDLTRTFDFFTNSKSFLKKIRKFYDIPKIIEVKDESIPNDLISINLCLLEDFMVNRLTENNYAKDIIINPNKRLAHHSKYSFNNLIKTYQEKMPSESNEFLETVLKIGLEEKMKLESEKYYHPIKFLAKSFILKKIT